jgi:hypothetical protein
MTNVLVVNKNGNIEETVIELDKLYTVCDYKSNKDFEHIHTYDNYEIYGKTKGKPDNENKYVFPNLNKEIYGKICIVKKNDNLTMSEWCKFYEITEKNDTELTFEDYEPE